MPDSPAFPRWISTTDEHNLREVAPDLYVGAELSPGLRPAGTWSAVVDLYGSSEQTDRWFLYGDTHTLLTWPFLDGDTFPDGLLDTVGRLVHDRRSSGPILLHCQAGLSRSASCAYAMMRTLDRMPHAETLRRVQEGTGYEARFPRTDTIASARRWAKKRIAR